jgi:hypothetical protein
MGINSTEVSYGFGQMGSAFTNLAFPIFPPQDHVIVAIHCLGISAFSVLETETLHNSGPQFLTHQNDDIFADGGPDANFAGVTFAEVDTGGVVATGVITLTDHARNGEIKQGQVVLIGDDATEGVDNGLTVDTAAGHIDPIYQGPNKRWMEVVSLAADNVTLTVKEVGRTVASTGLTEIDNLDGANRLYFLDPFHGGGGSAVDSFNFPAGATIYGRWTKVQPSTTTGVICYFGK